MKKLLLLLLFPVCTLHAQQHFTLYFDTNKAVPTADSDKEFMAWISAHKDVEVSIIHGHADAVGADEDNKILSQNRADYVAGRLEQAGFVPKWQIKATGEEQSQTGPNAENRKVTVWYAPKKQPAKAHAPIAEATQEPEPATGPNAPAISVRSLAAEVQSAREGDRLELKNMNFEGGTSRILRSSENALLDLLDIMEQMPSLKIEIQGHICCSRNDPGELSLERARAVHDFLIKNGIDKSRLSYKGFGGTRPIHFIPEFDDRQREANRRVEIQIVAM